MKLLLPYMQMQYCVCLYTVCVLSHIEIRISYCSSCLRSLNDTTWSSVTFNSDFFPSSFLFFSISLTNTLLDSTFFSLPSHSPISPPFLSSFFSQVSFSISLYPSPFYLFLKLDSSFSSICNQITYPRSDVLWN